jgi:hypothetical protein
MTLPYPGVYFSLCYNTDNPYVKSLKKDDAFIGFDDLTDKPFYLTNEVEVEYTVPSSSKAHYSMLIKDELSDNIWLSTTDIIPLDARGAYEVEVDCDDSDENRHESFTYSLANANVVAIAGGYVLDLDTGNSNYPNPRVLVVTNAQTFNKHCSCALESAGTYFCESQRESWKDYDGSPYSIYTKVKLLRKRKVKTLDNVYLNLADSEVIKSIMTRIDALEKKI